MNKDDLVKEWLDYSLKDLESAKFLTAMVPEPFEIICFHCQQSVEKALKAVLYKKNVRPPKTHDLDELITLCAIKEVEDFRESVLPLNDYSVMIRYPSLETVEEQDTRQATHAAEQFFSMVSDLISK